MYAMFQSYHGGGHVLFKKRITSAKVSLEISLKDSLDHSICEKRMKTIKSMVRRIPFVYKIEDCRLSSTSFTRNMPIVIPFPPDLVLKEGRKPTDKVIEKHANAYKKVEESNEALWVEQLTDCTVED